MHLSQPGKTVRPFIAVPICLFVFVLLSINGMAQEKPNILWITCDDLSPFLGAYGDRVVKTPNLDALAKEGTVFTRAFATSAGNAASRSAVITGIYPTTLGTQNECTGETDSTRRPGFIPKYAAVLPPHVKCFPEYLRRTGYFTTNNQTTDYQFEEPVTVWDESGAWATYRHREPGQPFFSVFNLSVTRESQLGVNDILTVAPEAVTLPPYFDDTPTARADMARCLSHIGKMDEQVGEIIRQLKQEGLYEKTVIFFFAVNGGPLPWMKGEVLDRGTRVPLIVRVPGQAPGTNDELVSLIDLAPSVLSLASIEIPAHIQGHALLGQFKGKLVNTFIYTARDRMLDKYDRVRAVRSKEFAYVLNYLPDQPSYLELPDREAHVPMMKEILLRHRDDQLNAVAAAWFRPRPPEELYDLRSDSLELHNLAAQKSYRDKLQEFRFELRRWEKSTGDISAIPEEDMILNWWDHSSKPPVTALPSISPAKKGVTITCATDGASIGYRVIHSGELQIARRDVQTWDVARYSGPAKNGDVVDAGLPWNPYSGGIIHLKKGDRVVVCAMRIGFDPATTEYVMK